MSKTKKKVISLVVDTELTNEQIEKGEVKLTIHPASPSPGRLGPDEIGARNVRVLDSD